MASLLKMVSQFAALSMKSAVKTSVCGLTLRSSSTLTRVNHQFCVQTIAKSPLISTTKPFLATTAIQKQPLQIQPSRTYKVKAIPKLRCSSCFFVRRRGRLFVECKARPRHKQMQMMARRNLFKDDYTIGKPSSVRRACFAKWRKDRYYDLGNNQYSRHDWLEGKIGHTI